MHRYWNDGWNGGWWWMAIMMVAFWGGIIWTALTVIRHTSHTPHLQAPGAAPAPAAPAARARPRRSSPNDLPVARSNPTTTANASTRSNIDRAPSHSGFVTSAQASERATTECPGARSS